GDERRFRGGDRGRRDDGPGRHGDLRPAPGAAGARTGGTMTIKGLTVGFVGGGNMGEALIKGLLGANLVPAGSVHATDVCLPPLPHCLLRPAPNQHAPPASTASSSLPTTRSWSAARTS